jgi:hypothetical protein
MERKLTWGVAIGVAVGSVIGIAIDNLALGIGIGIALGAAGAGGWSMIERSRENGDPPPPRGG